MKQRTTALVHRPADATPPDTFCLRQKRLLLCIVHEELCATAYHGNDEDVLTSPSATAQLIGPLRLHGHRHVLRFQHLRVGTGLFMQLELQMLMILHIARIRMILPDGFVHLMRTRRQLCRVAAAQLRRPPMHVNGAVIPKGFDVCRRLLTAGALHL